MLDIKNMKVLSVDDNRSNLMIIEALSKKNGLVVDSFQDARAALEASKNKGYDIIIVDYMMPEMDGFEFIRVFRKRDIDTPIIMITAAGEDVKLQLEALEVGATDFLTKPVNGGIFLARVRNLLSLKKSISMISHKAELLEFEVGQAVQEIKDREIETLQALGKLAEYKDPETTKHVIRVAKYSALLAKTYGLDKKEQDIVLNAAPFHDIGKVGIPDRILLKPGRLNGEEWVDMQTHASIGYEILKDSKSVYLHAGAIISYSHHEKYNGTGYPRGLKGEEIPLYGRIVAIADVFDALCSKRPYKELWDFEEAYKLLIDERGKHFDPKLVDCFTACIGEVREIHRKYKEA